MRFHMRFVTVIIAATIVVALVAFVFLMAWDNGDVTGNNIQSTPTPFGEYSPGSVAEVPLSSGNAMIMALGLRTLEDYERYSVDLMSELGVTWVRVDFLFDGWHFDEPSSLQMFRQAGIEVIGTARPVNHATPKDLSRFEDELAKLIDSYPWIDTWQIGNEPNIHWEIEDYARLFLSGGKVVRERCPECTLMLAGVAARFPDHEEAIRRYSRILDAIDAGYSGYVDPFDAFDMHYYGFYGNDADMPGLVDAYRAILQQHGYSDTSFWVTETSTFSGSPSTLPAGTVQTEEQQASELVRRFVVMLNAGVTHVAWSRPYENYHYRGKEDGYYDHNALVYNGFGEESQFGIAAGSKKLAFQAYHTMIEKLRGFSGVVKVSGGQYRFIFEDGRPPVYIAWAVDGNTALVEPSGQVRVTGMDGGEAVADTADIVLSEAPVFVDPVSGGGT